MARTLRALLAVTTLVLMGAGCDWVFVTVEVPDYDSASVSGIWMHRMEAGEYQPVNRIEFLESEVVGGVEVLKFRFHDGTHDTSYDWKTAVERDPTNDDSVTINLTFARPVAGSYKVSSFNEVGESDLSLESLSL